MLDFGYFKGWYFKCTAENKTIALIPAYHRCNSNVTASLQIITDYAAYNIPFDSLQYSERPLNVKVGSCEFSEVGIKLDINTDNLKVMGAVKFNSLTPIRYDIMGPFKISWS